MRRYYLLEVATAFLYRVVQKLRPPTVGCILRYSKTSNDLARSRRIFMLHLCVTHDVSAYWGGTAVRPCVSSSKLFYVP